MRIVVRVKPRSKKEYVRAVAERSYVVAVRAVPSDGAANEAVIKALARYFDLAPSLIRLVSGASGKRKIFELDRWEFAF